MDYAGRPPDKPPDINRMDQDDNIEKSNININNTWDGKSKNKGETVSNKSDISTDNIREHFLYQSSDVGPFHLYIENNTPNFKGQLNAIKIGDIILSNFSNLDNKITSIDSIGKNRIRIKFKDYQSANFLINQKTCSLFTNNNLDVYVPKFILHRQGIIRDIDIEFSEEYIKNKIKQYDMHCKFEVVSVRRINRKVEKHIEDKTIIDKVPTKSCIINFKAQTLPKYITINKVIKDVEPYVQKVLLCFSCLRFGHLGFNCKARPRCNKCHDFHNTKDCTVNEYTPTCFSCQGNHFTTHLSSCPEFSRQKQIKNTMSSLNLNFFDACKQIPKVSYANVAARNSSSSLPTNSNQNEQSYQVTPNQSASSAKKFSSQMFFSSNNPEKINFKRHRPSSPNTLESARKEILSQENIPKKGGIYNTSKYTEHTNTTNLQTQGVPSQLNNVILELVLNIISSLKLTENLDKSKTEIIQQINRYLSTAAISQEDLLSQTSCQTQLTL
uniref:Uncharacterized protein LOC114325718 n=1 Tax=Diabrotica virgifera virgifera TaxID=50390 RepID=A0A6P7F463_DIAVI